MKRGDQVYAIRKIVSIPYEHHGIDCGDGTIIHYSKLGEAAITRTPRATFARNTPIYVKTQPATTFIPDVVVERAESRLGERQYDLFLNNCEHFANWCKTGNAECRQLRNFGLQLNQVGLPQVSELVKRARQTQSPEQTKLLFQEALGNVAIATRTLLPEYEKATADTLTWHRVAQRALARKQEDVARAALRRKVAAKKKARSLKQKLAQLSDLQLTLEQNQTLIPSSLHE